MDYSEQQRFLRGSRLWGCLLVAVVFFFAALCARTAGNNSATGTAVHVLLTIALGAFVYYTPDYLHLTINPEKAPHWAIKIRWRLISAALLFVPVLPAHRSWLLVIAVVYLLICNWLARKVPPRFVWLYLWIAELALLTPLLLTGQMGLLTGSLLLAASVHLAIVVSDYQPIYLAGIVLGVSLIIIYESARQLAQASGAMLAASGFLLAVAASTMLLVQRAEKQNRRNAQAAIHELTKFTGYPIQRIRELWAVSNQQLAENWKRANIDEKDPERMADWYRQNSELYLFALSAYNLEYKRIRSNLNVLRLAAGSCLDYGAGNGEILLELAKRGHRVAYYDVEGETMRFARCRAEMHGLTVEFFHSKSNLAAAAKQRGFDTIFSLDVLEHLPDLKGELNFLSSLLNPGGLLVFDVPAGATKAHPMHLNHAVDVVRFLRSKGMLDERSLWKKLPFKKEEKYFFRASHGQELGTVSE